MYNKYCYIAWRIPFAIDHAVVRAPNDSIELSHLFFNLWKILFVSSFILFYLVLSFFSYSFFLMKIYGVFGLKGINKYSDFSSKPFDVEFTMKNSKIRSLRTAIAKNRLVILRLQMYEKLIRNIMTFHSSLCHPHINYNCSGDWQPSANVKSFAWIGLLY